MDKVTILIIEDDIDIRESVKILLEGEGFNIEQAGNGEQGLEKINKDVDLVILDIMLPGLSGFQICEEIRKKSVVPILFLTAKSSENDKVLGFMAGGDDYLVKPFSYVELLARIKALLRRQTEYNNSLRAEKNLNKGWIEHNDLKINMEKNEVYVRGCEVALTETEYEILLLLAKNPQQIYSVQDLYEEVWREMFHSDSTNTVMVHIRRLRKKVEENAQKPKIILTVWGKGYRIG